MNWFKESPKELVVLIRGEPTSTASEPTGETHPSAHSEAISNPADSGAVIESSVAMDGAICMRASDGSILIKKRNLRNWVVLLTLGSFALILGVATTIVLVLGRFPVTGESLGVLDRVESACLLSSLMTAFGVPIVLLVRSILRPPVCVDVVRRVLKVGRGASVRRIPFSDISHVVTQPLLRPLQTGVFQIGVILEHGELLRLGTVSGVGSDTTARVETIAQWIAAATGTESRWGHSH